MIVEGGDANIFIILSVVQRVDRLLFLVWNGVHPVFY